jgi:hypothetical protein
MDISSQIEGSKEQSLFPITFNAQQLSSDCSGYLSEDVDRSNALIFLHANSAEEALF